MRSLTTLLILLLCSLLAGCLVDDLKGQPNNTDGKTDGVDEHHFYVSGRIVKGVFEGANVRAYPIVGGQQALEPVAESVTDARGSYQLRIPREYIGKSALVRASTLDARMKCDLMKGCGQQDFASWVLLENESLFIDIGVPELRESGIYNGSVLTHLGFAVAKTRLPEGISANGISDTAAELTISKANSEVASTFGVIGDLPSLNIVDVTDPDERASADSAVLHYSLINAVAVATAIDAYAEPDFSQALFKLTNQFAESGIPGNSNDGAGEVTQASLLEALAAAYVYLGELDGNAYSEIQSEILALRALYLSEPLQEYGRGVSSNSFYLTFVEKAKRMVRGVRDVALSLDLRKLVDINNLSGLLSGEVTGVLGAFGVVVDTSLVLKDEKVDQIQLALETVSKATFDTLLSYYQKTPQSPLVHGISISHYAESNSHRFVIRDNFDACSDAGNGSCEVPIDLVILLEFGSFGGNTSVSSIRIDNLRMTILGTVGDAEYRLIFPGSEPQFVAGVLFLEDDSDENRSRTFLEVRDWRLSLPVSVVAEEQGSQSSLNGALNSTGEELVLRFESEDESIETDSVTEFVSDRLYELSHLRRFSLNAAFSVDTTGEDRFLASIDFTQGVIPFDGRAAYRISSRKACGAEKDECVVLEDESGIEGETAESFVQLSASVAYKANLKAIEAPVMIQMSGSRESPSTNKVSSLKVSYPGHALALNGRFSNNGGIIALDAVNLDGMRLYFDTINGKRTGAVETPAKESVAEIIDMGQWVKVRYLDGYFESLL